jgi:eukaryotic-like serine/threonine-protein kinase
MRPDVAPHRGARDDAAFPPALMARYRLDQQIGAGSTSVVYRAVDRIDGSVRALKMVPATTTLDRSRILRELLALARLADTSSVALHGVVSEQDRCVFVLEHVPGTMVLDVIHDGPGSVTASMARAVSIARAVETIHVRGVVHRDLMPRNLIESPTGGIRVLDFGSAWCPAWGDVRSSGVEARGTPWYAAPEQLAFARPTPAADVYSLGVILLELLTGVGAESSPGRPPTPIDVLDRVTQATARRDRPPAPLVRLVRSMIAADKRCRPRHAGEVADALEALLAGAARVSPS